MADVKVSRIDDIAPYDGPGTIPGIRFRSAGRALGVSAWGMNVLQIDAGCTGYFEHDHVKDGQEEVYVVLEGEGSLQTAGEETPLARGTLVRVSASTMRKIIPGPRGVTVLAIGGIPGKAYPAR
ncbi:MAG: cupin domain-containing protein [Candidatus Polarisedimenticolia bacterium]